MYYSGSPHVVANSRILAITADDPDDTLDLAPYGIGIREERTLEYLETIPESTWGDWEVSIAGEGDSEKIMTSTSNVVNAYGRGSGWRNVINLSSDQTTTATIPTLGSDKHFIVGYGNVVRLFRASDLSLVMTIVVATAQCDIEVTALEWGPDGWTHFAALHGDSIFVVAFDATNESMAIEQTVSTGSASIRSVALADEYIVGGSKDKKLHVWDRSTGKRLHSDLCDADYRGYDELEEDDAIYPLGLHCQGHVL